MDDRTFELHAEVCKTLANPWRPKLIELLRLKAFDLMREVLWARLAERREVARALSRAVPR